MFKLWIWSYFSECAKSYIDFKIAEKFHSIFLVLETMAFEPKAGIYLNYDDNTCDLKSKCYQTVLRF